MAHAHRGVSLFSFWHGGWLSAKALVQHHYHAIVSLFFGPVKFHMPAVIPCSGHWNHDACGPENSAMEFCGSLLVYGFLFLFPATFCNFLPCLVIDSNRMISSLLCTCMHKAESRITFGEQTPTRLFNRRHATPNLRRRQQQRQFWPILTSLATCACRHRAKEKRPLVNVSGLLEARVFP
jgi:hypothetical protein